MTVREAIDKQISRIRLPYWQSEAYAELIYFADGTIGPWAHIVEPTSEAYVLIMDLGDDDSWEEYTERMRSR